MGAEFTSTSLEVEVSAASFRAGAAGAAITSEGEIDITAIHGCFRAGAFNTSTTGVATAGVTTPGAGITESSSP